ncbi:hypothetical protein QJQ45_012600 [Haematococcus lacustris]|nr:hypothetical protein QJQ45_012600 [Haematococcus lacustris]
MQSAGVYCSTDGSEPAFSFFSDLYQTNSAARGALEAQKGVVVPAGNASSPGPYCILSALLGDAFGGARVHCRAADCSFSAGSPDTECARTSFIHHVGQLFSAAAVSGERLEGAEQDDVQQGTRLACDWNKWSDWIRGEPQGGRWHGRWEQQLCLGPGGYGNGGVPLFLAAFVTALCLCYFMGRSTLFRARRLPQLPTTSPTRGQCRGRLTPDGSSPTRAAHPPPAAVASPHTGLTAILRSGSGNGSRAAGRSPAGHEGGSVQLGLRAGLADQTAAETPAAPQITVLRVWPTMSSDGKQARST